MLSVKINHHRSLRVPYDFLPSNCHTMLMVNPGGHVERQMYTPLLIMSILAERLTRISGVCRQQCAAEVRGVPRHTQQATYTYIYIRTHSRRCSSHQSHTSIPKTTPRPSTYGPLRIISVALLGIVQK